jgi:chemotaxis protein MotB
MSQDSRHEHAHEIIIVKHRGEEHDSHHGGVWKIAFADFMTALMCFFLVMWLINAANEETKVSVASYFNPIKLVDRNPSKRGLEEAGSGPKTENGAMESESQNESKSQSSTGADAKSNEGEASQKASDDHLFSDPYAVLAEIAADSGQLQNLSAKGDGGAQVAGAGTGASGGESYRDPFAPDFWSKQIEPDDLGEPDLFEQRQSDRDAPQADPLGGGRLADTDGLDGDNPFAPPSAAQLEAAAAEAAGAGAGTSDKTGVDDPGQSPQDAAIAKIAEEIRAEIAKAFGSGEKIAEGITVEVTPRGLMISVTDQLDYGMFEIGSAVPRRDLVLAMEKVASILNGRSGAITINGHTDGRPFRNETYDNWRLSTARAHSAYYMLVRGGLDERRVMEVSGYADRQLKVPGDPNSDRNRRIEIFLEAGG